MSASNQKSTLKWNVIDIPAIGALIRIFPVWSIDIIQHDQAAMTNPLTAGNGLHDINQIVVFE